MWTRRRLVIGWVVLAVWVGAVGIWATLPATDHVPTGIIDGESTSVVVECGAPIDGSPGPAVPVVPPEPPRALQHIPCEAQHRSNQISLVIDAIVALAAVGVLISGERRLRARTERPDARQRAAV